MRPDQQRVQTLLTDTVTLLCKNGLHYNKELKVQGLLGITLDDEDVFVVHINKIFDEVRGKVASITAESQNAHVINNMNNITSLNSFGQFENVDGLSFDDEDAVDTMSNGMQLPVIHAQPTSILSRGTNSVAKKSTNRGTKRPVGAAKRKESRSVKQRLSSSFAEDNEEIHHIQMNKDTGYTPEYQEIHVKDEPPDQLIITDINNADLPADHPALENISQASTYNSTSSHDSYTPASKNSLVMYESLEDCDESSPAASKNKGEDDGAMDMIECLLYNEGTEHNKPAGMFKKVHISGAEEADSMDGSMGADDTIASCSGWEESIEFNSSDLSPSDYETILTDTPHSLEPVSNHGNQHHFKTINSSQNSSRVFSFHEIIAQKRKAVNRIRQRRRRPVASTEKSIVCPFEGCGLKYYRKDNMIRHHMTKHGSKIIAPATPPP